MAVSPPYSIDATAPVATALVSAYPTTEHTFRDTVSSWLNQIANPTDGKIRADQFSDSPAFTGAATLNGNPIDAFPSGTAMTFWQTSAPTGWTKSTAHDNKALRVVSGTAGSGGSLDFTAAFGVRANTGSVGSTVAAGTVGGTGLTAAQMAPHYHSLDSGSITISASGDHQHTISATFNGSGTSSNGGYIGVGPGTGAVTSVAGNHTHTISGLTNTQGSGASHTHSFTGTVHSHTFTGDNLNLSVKYVDLILAVKD